MQNWARDRLRSTGEGGPARFVIRDARTTIHEFPVQPNTIRDQIAERYAATVAATLALFDPGGGPPKAVTIRGTAARDIRESAPPSYREQARFLLVRDLMRDFDRDAELQIRANLGAYLAPAGES